MLFPRLRGAFARFGFLAEIGVACVFAATVPGRAVDMHAKPKVCEGATYEQALKTGRAIAAAHPRAVFTDYSDEQAAKLLAAFNAKPPASNYAAEHILVVETHAATDDDEDGDGDSSPVLFGLVHDGCVIATTMPHQSEWAEFRREAIGDPL